MNRLVGFRKMLGYTQKDMANDLGISLTAYLSKEKGYTDFRPSEMEKIKILLEPIFPNITIDAIFFANMQRKVKK